MKRKSPISDIETRRAQAGITVVDLCREARVSHTTWVRLKNGTSKRARAATIENLKRALDALAQGVAA
jgi:predicted transcriptional regulator